MSDSHASLTLTDDNFETEVTSFDGVVLVDFWAAWCGPCQMMAPFVENLATKMSGDSSVKIAKLDVDANMKTAQAHNILSIPSFKIFKNGEVVAERVGAMSEADLEAFVQSAL